MGSAPTWNLKCSFLLHLAHCFISLNVIICTFVKNNTFKIWKELNEIKNEKYFEHIEAPQ